MSTFNVLDPDVEIDCNLIIEASAGCGKTYAIERLVVKLLQKGYKLSEIVITTFTKKGAADLKERVFANIKKAGLKVDFDEAIITTIHGFSHKLLLEDPLESDKFFESLISPERYNDIVLDYMREMDKKWPLETVEPYLKDIKSGLIKNALSDHPAILQDFKNHFATLKEKEALFTYDDLIEGLHKRVKNQAKLKKLQSRFRIGIIDEFQDTDPLQWEIFTSIFHHDEGRLYLVGDPKQSIYSFRNADIYTYIEAQEILGLEAKRTLTTNYRSDPTLLTSLGDFFHLNGKNSFFKLPRIDNFLPNPTVLAPQGKIDTPFFNKWDKLQFFYTLEPKDPQADLFNFIAARIQELHKLEVNYSSMAILVDQNKLGYEIQTFLLDWNIPSEVVKEKDDESNISIKILNKIIHAVSNPKNDATLKEALLTPFFNWNFEDLQELNDLFIKEKIVWEFIKLGEAFLEGQSFFIAQLLNCRLKDFSVREELLKRKEGETWLEELEKESLKDLSEEDISKPTPLVVNRGVQILTMHKSKGLEFDVVFPLGLSIRRQDKKNEIEPEEKLAEKMRLLYVALTRAKRQLFVPLDLGKKKSNLKTLLDHYFSFILDKPIPQITVEDLQNLGLKLVPASGSEKYEELGQIEENDVYEPIEFIPQIPLQEVLSFTKIKRLHHKEKTSEILIDLIEDLPKGAETGLFFHEIYEKIPLELCKNAKLPSDYLNFLTSFTLNTPWDAWKDRLAAILFESFNKIHPQLPFSLCTVVERQSFREIEFLESHPAGFMKGVIDWLFVKDGRYYIVDWKSNYAVDYSEESLKRIMQEEDYNLQAEIYKNAAFNYLKRFSDLEFGGVYYYFLRGGKLWRAL